MKGLLILLLCPLAAVAQLPGRADDSLRKVSDTMHFPRPFEFQATATTNLAEHELLSRCYRWIKNMADSLPNAVVVNDPAHRKIMAGNIPATADISFSIVINVTGNKYRCRLMQYVYHTIDGARIPVEQAAATKGYKTATNVERVIIVRKYPLIFSSLNAFVKQTM